MNAPSGTVPRITLSIPEAAMAIGVSRGTVYAMMRRSGLRTIKVGRRRLVPLTELERLAADEHGASA